MVILTKETAIFLAHTHTEQIYIQKVLILLQQMQIMFTQDSLELEMEEAILWLLNSPGLNVWCQDIEIEPETTYITSGFNGNQALLQFSINGETIGTSFSAPNTTGTWSEFNATWNSNTSTNAEICIVNQNTSGGGNDFGLDNISFSTLCTSSESITVTEIDPANATIFNVDDLCESGPIVNLNAVDAGGTWTKWNFKCKYRCDPNLAGPGTHNIIPLMEPVEM